MKKSTKYHEINLSLRRKSIKKYFKKISKDGIVTNKIFWSMIKPFLTILTY